MNKVVILAVTSVALGAVLWMKPRASNEALPLRAQESGASDQAAEEVSGASVLLFADPREAESSCACAEVIRLARDARTASGVSFREFDTRDGTAEAKHYGVRVSPTVIFTDAAGVETARFEGESQDVIAELDGALNLLQADTSREERSDQ